MTDMRKVRSALGSILTKALEEKADAEHIGAGLNEIGVSQELYREVYLLAKYGHYRARVRASTDRAESGFTDMSKR